MNSGAAIHWVGSALDCTFQFRQKAQFIGIALVFNFSFLASVISRPKQICLLVCPSDQPRTCLHYYYAKVGNENFERKISFGVN